ncbi:MAG: alkaline phosphatase D family protein, partial [Proteobacteria bacterium]|nr:alkaline phosphatase D family protein [Pseudomonadota bacterium]
AVIANHPGIDRVVHLGDYIYEAGENGFGGEAGKRIGRIHEPRHEIVSLDDYRRRHAQYKTDQGSLAMHARHPLIVIWDDHETANNPWMGGASNHQPEEGSWAARRAASLQAFYEWLPIRDPGPGGSRKKYWRHYKFGDLVSLITLESRHTGRSKQISYDEHLGQIDTPAQAQEFLRVVVGASNRNMLSPEMEGFLKSELEESVGDRRRWRLIGNQTVMAKSIAPVLDEALFDRLRRDLEGDGARILGNLTRLGELGLPEDMDIWDGYPVAREKFYQIAKDAGARDLLVLSGDSHSYWANSLYDADDQAMGVELGATGITSPRSLLALGVEGIQRFDELNAANNREIEWTDGRHRGFVRLRIDHQRAHADFVTVSDVESRRYTTRTVHAVDIVRADGTLRYD